MSRSEGQLPRFRVDPAVLSRWKGWIAISGGASIDLACRIERKIRELRMKQYDIITGLDSWAQSKIQMHFKHEKGFNVCQPADITAGDGLHWYEIAAERAGGAHWRKVYALLAAHCEDMKP